MVREKTQENGIYVEDHCSALIKIFKKGKIGNFYNIGSNNNQNNISIVKKLINISKKQIKLGNNIKITFIPDRPGHDFRYAINSNKIKKQIGWKPKTNLKEGLKKTFLWYKDNKNYFSKLNKKDIIKRLGKL